MPRLRIPGRAHQWRAAAACMLLLVPVPVPDSDDDRTGETSLTVGGGVAAYDREVRFQSGVGDCGPIFRQAHFNTDISDVGAAVERRTGRHSRVGVRTGMVRETADLVPGQPEAVNPDSLAALVARRRDSFYLNPWVAAEGRWAGIGGGLIFSSEPVRTGRTDYESSGMDMTFSGHLRLGSVVYASAGVGENVPLYSGGGYVNYGFGIDTRPLDLWGGMALGPWEDEQLLLKADAHPSRSWSVGASFRVETDPSYALPESEREYGLGLRVTRRFPGRRPTD